MKKLAIAIASVLLVGTVQAEVVSHGLTFDSCKDDKQDVCYRNGEMWIHAPSSTTNNRWTNIVFDKHNKQRVWISNTYETESYKFAYEFDLKNATHLVTYSVLYDKPFLEGTGKNVDISKQQWKPIQPNSFMEEIYEVLVERNKRKN